MVGDFSSTTKRRKNGTWLVTKKLLRRRRKRLEMRKFLRPDDGRNTPLDSLISLVAPHQAKSSHGTDHAMKMPPNLLSPQVSPPQAMASRRTDHAMAVSPDSMARMKDLRLPTEYLENGTRLPKLPLAAAVSSTKHLLVTTGQLKAMMAVLLQAEGVFMKKKHPLWPLPFPLYWARTLLSTRTKSPLQSFRQHRIPLPPGLRPRPMLMKLIPLLFFRHHPPLIVPGRIH